MKKNTFLFGRNAPFLAAACLLPIVASGETVLFEDDFNNATVEEQPTIPPWTIMTENDPEFGNTLLVRQDWADLFQKGMENQYLEFHGTNGAMVIAADLPDSGEEVVTLSFDFVEPDGGKTDPLIIFLYSGEGTTRADRLRLTHGGTGASAPAEGSRVYALDTLNRLDWVRNNSGARSATSTERKRWLPESPISGSTETSCWPTMPMKLPRKGQSGASIFALSAALRTSTC